jgi:hypothetical protein
LLDAGSTRSPEPAGMLSRRIGAASGALAHSDQ